MNADKINSKTGCELQLFFIGVDRRLSAANPSLHEIERRNA